MGRMSVLAQTAADSAHTTLAEGGVDPSSHLLTGAVVVADGKGNPFIESDNFTGHHVELSLLAKVFDYSRKKGQAYVLPASCFVLVYVYHSPCEDCVTKIRRSLMTPNQAWLKHSPHVKWKFVYKNMYVSYEKLTRPRTVQDRWPDDTTATNAYKQIAIDSNNRVTIKPISTKVKSGKSPRIG